MALQNQRDWNKTCFSSKFWLSLQSKVILFQLSTDSFGFGMVWFKMKYFRSPKEEKLNVVIIPRMFSQILRLSFQYFWPHLFPNNLFHELLDDISSFSIDFTTMEYPMGYKFREKEVEKLSKRADWTKLKHSESCESHPRSSSVLLQTLQGGALPGDGLPCAEAADHEQPFSTGMEVAIISTICIFDIPKKSPNLSRSLCSDVSETALKVKQAAQQI